MHSRTRHGQREPGSPTVPHEDKSQKKKDPGYRQSGAPSELNVRTIRRPWGGDLNWASRKSEGKMHEPGCGDLRRRGGGHSGTEQRSKGGGASRQLSQKVAEAGQQLCLGNKSPDYIYVSPVIGGKLPDVEGSSVSLLNKARKIHGYQTPSLHKTWVSLSYSKSWHWVSVAGRQSH